MPYTLTQSSQKHVKDTNGQDISTLCIWCYRITFDPGAAGPANPGALSGDWRLEVPSSVLPFNDPSLTAANVDPNSLPPAYDGGGAAPKGGGNVNVDFPAAGHPAPTIQPPNPAATYFLRWIDLCFVVNCGKIGTIKIQVDRRTERNFAPVTLEPHDRLNKNEADVNGPK
jgi:hypothetical protein